MTQMLIKSETLDEIANAIRTKTGKTEAMTPIEMARAINEPSSYAWKKYSVVAETPPAFSNATSWADIGSAIAADINGDIDLSTIWNIGDAKDVTLTTGETITLQIAGFNHDTYSDGVTAPVTLVMKDCLNTKAQMNSSNTNTGGYPASAMKTYVETNIYDKLPSDLKTLVAPVKKKWYTTYNDANSLTEGNYNVWLLSEMEVSGTNSYTVGTGEGTKYPIFTDSASRIKKVNGTNDRWWLGSCSGNFSDYFVVVYSNGKVSNYSAGSSYGVAAGLCPRGTTPQLQKTFLSYITSDSILSYPLNGQKGDYWYELVQSNVDWGEITLTSDQTAITVNHNLGEVPKWAGIFPNEKITAQNPTGNSTLFEIPFGNSWWLNYSSAGSLHQVGSASRSSFTDSQIVFNAYSSSYPFRSSGNGWGTYYWFALGSPKSLLPILSWQEIGDLVLKAEQGTVNLSDYFSIGDTKPVTLTTGETIELQVAGFNHDTFSDGVTAPVTFVMKDCLNTKAKMNRSSTNADGYPASAMKTYVETNIYDKLPSDLKALVAPVKKKWYTTYNDTSSLTEGNYNVWLLSEMEVFGTNTTNTSTIGTGEGSKYDIFTDNASRIKKVNGTASYWWLGSCSRKNSAYFVIVSSNGNVDGNPSNGSNGVAAGLCIRGNA